MSNICQLLVAGNMIRIQTCSLIHCTNCERLDLILDSRCSARLTLMFLVGCTFNNNNDNTQIYLFRHHSEPHSEEIWNDYRGPGSDVMCDCSIII